MNRSMQKKKESLAQDSKQAMSWHEGRIVFTNSKSLVGVGLPRQVTRTYTAPFARANREEDYRTAWDFFTAKKADQP